MNRRRSKKINKQTISIFLEWIASVVPEEEAKKIDPNNYKEYVARGAFKASKNTRDNQWESA